MVYVFVCRINYYLTEHTNKKQINYSIISTYKSTKSMKYLIYKYILLLLDFIQLDFTHSLTISIHWHNNENPTPSNNWWQLNRNVW